MKINKISCMMIFLSLCLLLGACTSTPTAKAVKEIPKEPIRVGVIGTFTGVGAYFGEQERRGLEIAKEEINSEGGVDGRMIMLIYEDSMASPTQAITAANKLISADNVKYIIGDSWAITTEKIIQLTNNNKVIVISGVAMLESMSQDDYFFRTIHSTGKMATLLADYAYNDMGSRVVGTIYSATPFGEEHARLFKEAFERLGGQVVVEERTDLAQQELRTELLKIKHANADTILNLHTSGLIGLAMKQAAEMNFHPKWLGSFGVQTESTIKDYKGFSEGIVYPTSMTLT